jgi:SAM-dependent methyltransferase
MAPFVAELLDAVGVHAGDVVLDVACGTGFAARAAAELVGPSGRVVGVDVNPAMLAVGAHASRGAQVPVEWIEAYADHLPFPPDTFDVAVCQQGLQFMPDLAAAVADAARVVRAGGGRIAATVWAPVEHSPFFAAQFRAVEAIAGPAAAASYLTAFSCTAEQLTAAFLGTKIEAVDVREVRADVPLPELPDFARGQLTTVPWGSAVVAARPDGLDVAAEMIADELGPGEADGTVVVPFVSQLIVGRR